MAQAQAGGGGIDNEAKINTLLEELRNIPDPGPVFFKQCGEEPNVVNKVLRLQYFLDLTASLFRRGKTTQAVNARYQKVLSELIRRYMNSDEYDENITFPKDFVRIEDKIKACLHISHEEGLNCIDSEMPVMENGIQSLIIKLNREGSNSENYPLERNLLRCSERTLAILRHWKQ
jgi:hypothetical protein